MGLMYLLIFGSVGFFGLTAVWALVWAVSNGQMEHFAEGARTIFDDEEPEGAPTDRFPDGKTAAGSLSPGEEGSS